MNSCTQAHTYQATETWLWEQEGQTWPDTSKPPDSQTSTPKEMVLEDDGFCLSVFTVDGHPSLIDPERACPEGGMFVRLPDVEQEQISSTTTWHQWVSVEPEIPHLKTHHIEKRKTTTWIEKVTYSWLCLDPSLLKRLGDQLQDYFPPPPKPQPPEPHPAQPLARQGR